MLRRCTKHPQPSMTRPVSQPFNPPRLLYEFSSIWKYRLHSIIECHLWHFKRYETETLKKLQVLSFVNIRETATHNAKKRRVFLIKMRKTSSNDNLRFLFFFQLLSKPILWSVQIRSRFTQDKLQAIENALNYLNIGTILSQAACDGSTKEARTCNWFYSGSLAKTIQIHGSIFAFPLVYKPYCRQVAGKIFLTIGQSAHEASSGFTDTPSMLFWAGERLSQVLAETVESYAQQQKVAGIVVSLSRLLLKIFKFSQKCHYLVRKQKACREKRAKLTNFHTYAFVIPFKVLKRTIQHWIIQSVSKAYSNDISPPAIVSCHQRTWLTTSWADEWEHVTLVLTQLFPQVLNRRNKYTGVSHFSAGMCKF